MQTPKTLHDTWPTRFWPAHVWPKLPAALREGCWPLALARGVPAFVRALPPTRVVWELSFMLCAFVLCVCVRVA